MNERSRQQENLNLELAVDTVFNDSSLSDSNYISSKKNWKALNPDQTIDLESIDPRFKGEKIESVCITKETKNFLHLVMVADNDNGSSSFLKLIIEKK